MGESHIQIATRRLAQKFGVEVNTDLPTIASADHHKTAQAQGRHKKQSGGRGQFGDVYCRFEPKERGEGFEFASEIFGGSVHRQYVPAVEKGVREVMDSGVLAGFPTVDFRCVLYDGSFHPVDSSELAFKLAAHLAFPQRRAAGRPGAVGEPVYKIEVTVPESFMGDILGDLKHPSRSGAGHEPGTRQRRGDGPGAPGRDPALRHDLRSMTQGRGMYKMEFSHYDIVPAHLVEKIAAEAAKASASSNSRPHAKRKQAAPAGLLFFFPRTSPRQARSPIPNSWRQKRTLRSRS
jgi:elongation factor G